MRGLLFVCGFLLLPTSVGVAAEMVTAKLDAVACHYHDLLWDKSGFDKQGRPKPELRALDTCKEISSGQKLELYERQNYAPGGLKIVRIDGKLYFVRVKDLEAAPKTKTAEPKANASKDKK